MKIEKLLLKQEDEFENDHFSNSTETPIRDDAFDLSDEEKKNFVLLIKISAMLMK